MPTLRGLRRALFSDTVANTRSGRTSSNSHTAPPAKAASGSAARAARAFKRACQHRGDSRVSRGGPVTRTGSEPSSRRPQQTAAAASGGPPLASLAFSSNPVESPDRATRLLRDNRARPGRWSAERQREAAKQLLDLSAASPSSSIASELVERSIYSA